MLGQIEDLALRALALNAFLKAVPSDTRAEHEGARGFVQSRAFGDGQWYVWSCEQFSLMCSWSPA